MRLVTDNGELTLPSDFSFEIEKNSAFFSEEGSASIGATIPATPADLAKLGYPTRLGRKDRFIRSFPAIIKKGVFQKKGVLVVASATEKSITCSMALEDSEFYSQHKEKNIRDIFVLKVLDAYSTPAEWSEWLQKVYEGTAASDFRVVPVAVNYDEETKTYQVNNEPESDSSYALLHSPRYVSEGGTNVSVPEGYGLAPYLKLDIFFSTLFGLLGYSVGYNCFSEHPVLQNLILLHGCADVVCNGRINYADLVPNKTVSEIIEWMEQKFHAQIAVNPESNSIDILLLDAVLASASDNDLTGKIIGYPTFSYENSSRVVITPDTSLEGATAVAETLQDMVDKYGGWAEYNEREFAAVTSGSLIFRAATGKFYEVRDSVPRLLGTNYFAYDRRNSEGAETFAPEDLMPPMVFVGGRLMPYVGERKHRNTSYNNSETDTEQAIIIASYAGKATSGRYYYATTQKYDDAGNAREGGYCMNAEDWYFDFFAKYGSILLNNKVTVEGRFDLSIEELLGYNLYALKQYDGQMILPTYLRYEVGKSIKCLLARFLLVKSFGDEVADNPIEIPAPTLKWLFNNSEWEALTSREPPTGMDYIYQFSPKDAYGGVMVPEFQLAEPSYLGQQSYHITRIVDVWLEDLRAGGGDPVYQGEETIEQWYDAVAI